MKALLSFSYENQNFEVGQEVNIDNQEVMQNLQELGYIGNDENVQKVAQQKAQAEQQEEKAEAEAKAEAKAPKVTKMK